MSMAARDEILSASAGVKNFAAAKLEERQTEPEQSESTYVTLLKLRACNLMQ